MDISIVSSAKNEVELLIKRKDPTVPEMLVHYLNQRNDVEFAGYKWEHPLASYPKVIIRTSGEHKAINALLDTIEDIRKDIGSLKEAIKKAE
jgi:DNA-directed RNA polymerase subunit L